MNNGSRRSIGDSTPLPPALDQIRSFHCIGLAKRRNLVEQITLGIRACTFDREQSKLGRDSTVRREAADSAAGREHAMARHDDRKRITSERLANRARPRRSRSGRSACRIA